MRLYFFLALASLCFLPRAEAGNANILVANQGERSIYYWESVPVGSNAQLNTLICRACDKSAGTASADVPLLAVLKDTLGDDLPENDRLTSVWLLSFERPTLAKRALSAIPFFYWRKGPQQNAVRAPSVPLLDLTSLQHPLVSALAHDIVQWTMLDSATTPIRASSRAYRSNEVDHERLHLEEALNYLRAAPSSNDSSALTQAQLNLLTARLELRKKLLGGLVSDKDARQVGEEAAYKAEQIRSRNWELLRQWADKTGLTFESLEVAGTHGQYSMLWFPADESSEPTGIELGPVWKLLGIKNPRHGARIASFNVAQYTRDLDESGSLLPFGAAGAKQVRLWPLAVYSLNYPKHPLLLVDFHDRGHLRRHEMLQRSINEITAGVIGISHFTNWYYYVAADAYGFVASRHGAAMDQSERLDCYSQFRVQLALDRQMEASLRRQMQQHLDSLALNPLESSPDWEIKAAKLRYASLQEDAQGNGRLMRSLDRDRRAELMADTQTTKQVVRDNILRGLTFGMYTHRSKADAENLVRIDMYRRFQYHLELLDQLADTETQPEVVYETLRIQKSIRELTELLPGIPSQEMRDHAIATIEQLRKLSYDTALQAECSTAVASLRADDLPGQSGVLLKPSLLHAPSVRHAFAGETDGH